MPPKKSPTKSKDIYARTFDDNRNKRRTATASKSPENRKKKKIPVQEKESAVPPSKSKIDEVTLTKNAVDSAKDRYEHGMMTCLKNAGLLDGLVTNQSSIATATASVEPSSSDDTVHCEGCGIELFQDQVEFHKCNTHGLTRAVVSTKTPEDWSPDDEIKAATKKLEEKELETEEGQKMALATTYGERHNSRICTMTQNLKDAINNNKAELGKLAELVEDASGELVPKAFLSLGGKVIRDKCRLASQILWLMVKDLRNKKAKEGECPFLQPQSQDTYLRSLISAMKEQYDWRYSLTDHFKFQGGLNARIATLYAERCKEWPNYGTASNRQIPQVFDTKDLDWSVFDESILYEHQLKSMGVCGIHLAFRGNKEHTHLMVENIVEGHFDPTHELAGMPFIGIDNFEDKAHKLTVHNNVKRKTNNMMRLPVEMDNLLSPGGTLKRYMDKMSPSQRRVYRRAASKKQR